MTDAEVREFYQNRETEGWKRYGGRVFHRRDLGRAGPAAELPPKPADLADLRHSGILANLHPARPDAH
jgi:hypothetical protein